MSNRHFNKIATIIYQYAELFLEKINKVEMDSISLEKGIITVTNIVPYDFFEGEKGALKDFGTLTILFNDLKKSTKLLEDLEEEDILHYYSYYMYYSSKMLSEILNLFDAKMVECTGDGNYSIFEEEHSQLLKEYDYFESLCYNKNEFNNYLNNFDEREKKFITSSPYSFDEKLRQLFFYIFYIFNIQVNKCFPSDFSNKFLTRVGCVTGKCQIMRIVNSHIRQDKLIGSVVHKSAHQASGKI
jgi:hypothetical protein